MNERSNRVLVAEVQVPTEVEAPITFDIEVHALKVALVRRENITALDTSVWNKPGVYVLIGSAGQEKTEVYVGRSGGGKQGVRGRLLNHVSKPSKNSNFPWWRAVAFLRDNTDGFNTAQIGYLEGRIAGELQALPMVSVRSDRGDIDTTLSEAKMAMLDEFLPSILSALSLAGLNLKEELDEKDEEEVAGTSKKYFGIKLSDLIASGDLPVGTLLVYKYKGKVAESRVTSQGGLLVNNKNYISPSTAAKEAHNLRNRPRGWTDWVLKNNPERSLHDIREDYLKRKG